MNGLFWLKQNICSWEFDSSNQMKAKKSDARPTATCLVKYIKLFFLYKLHDKLSKQVSHGEKKSDFGKESAPIWSYSLRYWGAQQTTWSNACSSSNFLGTGIFPLPNSISKFWCLLLSSSSVLIKWSNRQRVIQFRPEHYLATFKIGSIRY